MQRHLTSGALRPRRPASEARAGFTLVELLVVITIIAMLVGLLIPAVMRAREAGRRATCLNNQQQIGKAILHYVTSKNKFPPLFTAQPHTPPLATPTAVGWVPPMLPYLEQNPLYQIFQADSWYTLQNAEVETLNCPSRDPTNSPAPLSYVVNAGMEDRYRTDGEPLDYRENGLFFDDFCWKYVSDPFYKPPVSDLSYVNQHDGTAMTLMVSENTNARDWIAVNYPVGNPPTPSASNFFPWPPTYIANSAPVNSRTWWQGFTWRVRPQSGLPATWGRTGSSVPGKILNQPPQGGPSDFYWGPPSSKHPGGFIVTMADGHSQFMSDEIEYRVYCLLAAPDSNNAKDPLYKMPHGAVPPNVRFKYPDSWYTMYMGTSLGTTAPLPLLKPLTDADLNP